MSDALPTPSPASGNFDARELAKFSALAHRWWDPTSEFRPLHEINPLRLNHVERLAGGLAGKRVLDVGCGGGILAEAMAKRGAQVTGIDLGEKPIKVAALHAIESGAQVDYRLQSAESLAEERPGSYDVVTSYSFLHHLYDCGPTLQTAARALKPGGRLYVDLEPNYDFWAAVSALERHGAYDPIVTREIEMVTYKDEDIEKQFGVSADVFNHAEYGKSMLGGFGADYLRAKLADAGFEQVEFFYEWFIGQGQMINDEALPREQRFANAAVVHDHLQWLLPLSRSLFKYIGFVAVK